MAVKKNDRVKVSFSYSAEGEDKELGPSNTSEPIELQVGSGEVIQGVEEAVIGMEKGEKKKVTVSPDKAFGKRKEELVQKGPKELLQDRMVREGDFVELQTADKQVLHARVISIDEDCTVLDLNHPLAGRTLNFEIELVDIKS